MSKKPTPPAENDRVNRRRVYKAAAAKAAASKRPAISKARKAPKTPKTRKPETAQTSEDLLVMRAPSDLDKILDWVDAVNDGHNQHSAEIRDQDQRFEYLHERLLEQEQNTGPRVDALEEVIELVRRQSSTEAVVRDTDILRKEVWAALTEQEETIKRLIKTNDTLVDRCDALEKFLDPLEEHIYGSKAGAKLDVDINTMIAYFIRENVRLGASVELEVD